MNILRRFKTSQSGQAEIPHLSVGRRKRKCGRCDDKNRSWFSLVELKAGADKQCTICTLKYNAVTKLISTDHDLSSFAPEEVEVTNRVANIVNISFPRPEENRLVISTRM
jgi:hypothetical protein